MSFTLVQAGTALEMYDTSGNHGVVTLPTGVVLSSALFPRFCIFGRYVICVNSPSRPITVDGDGIARVFSPRPPASPPVLSAVAGGSLTGTYQVKQTYYLKDALGNIIAESDFGPTSATQAVSAQYLRASSLPLSPDAVTGTRLYRNTTLGAVFYPWVDMDGNVQTSIQDDLADAGLSITAAPTLGGAPDLTLVAQWRGRVWGMDRVKVDDLRFTSTGRAWAWPALNTIPIPKIGTDSRGVTALMTRKDALAVGRQNAIHQISGNNDNSQFKPIVMSEQCGVESQESVAVYLDTAYFLWKDGVYQWDGNGIKCISDGKVRSWFATGDYFNQSQFQNAFGFVDPNTKRYKLFLCSVGSSTIDRWVEYDIVTGKWWGPHKTGAFTPSCGLIAWTPNNVLVPMIGSATGYLFKEQATRTDSVGTAIDFDVDTKRHDANTPQTPKAWKDLRIASVPGAGRLIVTASVGSLDAPASTRSLAYDLSESRGTIGKIGVGFEAGLNFRQNVVGQDVQLTGYELDFHELGVR